MSARARIENSPDNVHDTKYLNQTTTILHNDANDTCAFESPGEWTVVSEKKQKTDKTDKVIITAEAEGEPLETVAERIRQREEELIETENCIITPVKLEFTSKTEEIY